LKKSPEFLAIERKPSRILLKEKILIASKQGLKAEKIITTIFPQ